MELNRKHLLRGAFCEDVHKCSPSKLIVFQSTRYDWLLRFLQQPPPRWRGKGHHVVHNPTGGWVAPAYAGKNLIARALTVENYSRKRDDECHEMKG